MDYIARFTNLYSNLSEMTSSELAAVYTDDIEFIDPITTHYGLDAVKAYFSNLLEQASQCQFDIQNIIPAAPTSQGISHTVTWTMSLQLRNGADPIVVEGITIIKIRKDGIYYHRDYYDLGEMVYEHVPVLRWFINKIKKRLAE